MRKWIPPLVIVVAFAASAAVYSELPERMPTHWNMRGEVDGWTPLPWGAFIIPLVLLVGLPLFHVFPKIDPRGANYSKFRGTYEVLIITVMLFLFGIHVLVLATALGADVSMTRVVPVGIGILMIVLGNIMPRTRSNWFVGIRTPWTLSSDRVWERTHRFGGRLFVAGGVLIVLTAVLTPEFAHAVMIGSAAGASVAALAYSYFAWRSDPDARKNVPQPGARGR